MRVIEKGRLPDNDTFEGRCHRCQCKIEVFRKELASQPDGRNGTDWYYPCPTPDCGSRIYFDLEENK